MEQSFQKGVVLHLASLIEYTEGGVISKQLIKSPAGNITLFSFDKGEEKNIINLEQCAELLQVLKTMIKNVEIYLNSNDKNGTSKTEITDGTSLKTDSTGTYAEILIPNNFKGTVAAKVTDNVEHTTGLISADGSVIEDDSLHKSVSSIDIKATNDTD